MAVIAEAYLDKPANISFAASPGRKVSFYGGYARMADERDVTIMLRRDDLTIKLDSGFKDWWADWINNCGEDKPAQAKIEVDGVIHYPPYATLLESQPPEVSGQSPDDQEGCDPAWSRSSSESVELSV